jgi:hypothetical protein
MGAASAERAQNVVHGPVTTPNIANGPVRYRRVDGATTRRGAVRCASSTTVLAEQSPSARSTGFMAVTASHAERRVWRACGRQHRVVRRRLEHVIEPAFGGTSLGSTLGAFCDSDGCVLRPDAHRRVRAHSPSRRMAPIANSVGVSESAVPGHDPMTSDSAQARPDPAIISVRPREMRKLFRRH